MYIGLVAKYLLLLSDFDGTCVFFINCKKKKITQIPNFIKICPEGGKLFHADRQIGLR